jgi:hypothetical protein
MNQMFSAENESTVRGHIGMAQALSKANSPQVPVFHTHNLVGCPHTQMWTKTPERLVVSVNYDDKIVSVTTSNGLPVNGAAVTIRKNDQYSYYTTNTDGQVALSSISFDSHVAVNKHNFLPSYTHFPEDKDVLSSELDLRGNVVVAPDIMVAIDDFTIPEHFELIVLEGASLNKSAEGTGKITVEGTLRLSNQQLNNLTVDVKSGGRLIITDNVLVATNANLMLRSGAVVEGNANANSLFVRNGECTIEPGATFTNLTHNGEGGLFVTHENPFTLEGVSFTNTNVKTNTVFTEVHIQNCAFNGSALNLDHFSNDIVGYCTVKNSTFTNTPAQEVLRIDDFVKFVVSDNVFENNMGTAIAVYNAGKAGMRTNYISNNVIHSNLNNGTAKGILTYATVADIHNNTIYGNDYGIALYHKSNVSVRGDKRSIENDEFQLIYNNIYNQLYAGGSSFPWLFELNVLRENDSEYPRVYSNSKTPSPINIAGNCWGNNFDPATDLYPYHAYEYQPVWDCGLNPGGGISTGPRVAYEEAISLLKNEQPEAAMVELKNIVNTWTESPFAAEAMKAMPECTQDLQALKTYFGTNTHIQQNEELKKLAIYLTADCHIKERDYQSALTIYEGIIANPPTMEDSIYAQIDAGRVQYLMEQEGNKAPVTFKYQHMIPKTHAAFTKNRKQLLDMLQSGKTESETAGTTETLNAEEALTDAVNIYPNPVSNELNVELTSKTHGTATLTIYSTTGQEIYTTREELKKEENNTYQINTTEFEQGIYVLQISINGTQTQSHRFVINR